MPLDVFPVQSRFSTLADQPLDAMLALMAILRADPRTDKIDLGIGVYSNAEGRTPILGAVKAAEKHLFETQASKAYIGAEGDMRMTELLAPWVIGPERAADPHYAGLQTAGGTGALRLALDLVARATPAARVWLGTPTWPNHKMLINAAELEVIEHPYFDKASQTLLFDAMMSALEGARTGDVVLLHGCCHNPSGADFTPDQWQAVTALVQRKGLLPLIDIAYQGLGNGMAEDAAGARALLDSVPEALLCASGSKNFGLYRDRIGALWIKTSDPAAARQALATCVSMARVMWSMPPDHGAAIIHTILDSAELTASWQAELAAIRDRLKSVRAAVAKAVPQLAFVAGQTGMFSLLPLTPGQIQTLRNHHAVYIVDNGRMNMAGLNAANLPRFADAMRAVL